MKNIFGQNLWDHVVLGVSKQSSLIIFIVNVMYFFIVYFEQDHFKIYGSLNYVCTIGL